MEKYTFEPIGFVKTCFKEKFGIPRQSGLAQSATGILRLNPHPFLSASIRELEGFSHIWVIFVFHKHNSKHWKPSIRPPRLGGAKKVGVLASRSPHRPNPIGMSVVKLEKIILSSETGGAELHLAGVDFLDETPVLDIKPYLPYADSIPEASSGWANEEIRRVEVFFSEKALQIIHEKALGTYPNIRELIQELLELDPRPAFQKLRYPPDAEISQGMQFGFKLFEFDVQWVVRAGKFEVTDLLHIS